MDEMLAQILAYVRGMWRYRWAALVAAWAVAVAGWVYVIQMPDVYRASAQVQVDTESVLKPLLQGLVVQPNVNQRVQMMSRTLLTRPTLEQVVRATDMHLQATTAAEMEAIINRVQSTLFIQGTDRLLNLYTILYQSPDPRETFEVVRALVNIFGEGLLVDTRADSEMARRFLDDQIREYEERLQAAEQRLADFRRTNAGLLPDDRGGYDQRLQQLKDLLRETELGLREAVNRRNEIQRQLASTDRGVLASRSLTPGLDNRIEAAQKRLDELTLSFTERHPDIITLRRTLEDLESQRDAEVNRLRSGGQTDASMLENPVYQEMRIALSNAQVEVSALMVRAEEHRRRIIELEQLVDTIPRVEADLTRLDRDYAVNRQNYLDLLQRRESAAITRTLEVGGEQAQFRVVEPPRIPLYPSKPNRPVLFAGVLLLGGVAGAGLALLLSLLKPVFDDRRTLTAVTGLPVLGTVALAPDAPRRFVARMEQGLFGVLGASLLLVFGLVVMFGGHAAQFLERVLTRINIG